MYDGIHKSVSQRHLVARDGNTFCKDSPLFVSLESIERVVLAVLQELRTWKVPKLENSPWPGAGLVKKRNAPHLRQIRPPWPFTIRNSRKKSPPGNG
ncbi:unnamed protein product, partial [Nesidiocoris tenuis]